MIIGEAPGKDEDRTGHPFVGSAGRLAQKIKTDFGLLKELIQDLSTGKKPGA
jgi:uracil-DNA glycosylase